MADTLRVISEVSPPIGPLEIIFDGGKLASLPALRFVGRAELLRYCNLQFWLSSLLLKANNALYRNDLPYDFRLRSGVFRNCLARRTLVLG